MVLGCYVPPLRMFYHGFVVYVLLFMHIVMLLLREDNDLLVGMVLFALKWRCKHLYALVQIG